MSGRQTTPTIKVFPSPARRRSKGVRDSLPEISSRPSEMATIRGFRMRSLTWISAAILLAPAVLSGKPLAAQERRPAAVEILVVDEEGKPVADAKVRALDALNDDSVASTDASGRCRLPITLDRDRGPESANNANPM